MTGRNCSVPEQGYFAANLDHFMHEAELAKNSPVCTFVHIHYFNFKGPKGK